MSGLTIQETKRALGTMLLILLMSYLAVWATKSENKVDPQSTTSQLVSE